MIALAPTVAINHNGQRKKPATPCKKFAKKAACLLPNVGAFINMYLPCDKG